MYVVAAALSAVAFREGMVSPGQPAHKNRSGGYGPVGSRCYRSAVLLMWEVSAIDGQRKKNRKP